MSHEMLDLLRSNSPGHPISSQAEQHPQRSEVVHYLRGLNQWLEWDVHERRARLEQTQNKVIPLLNRIVEDMDSREGASAGVVRSPSDGQQNVIPSYPLPHVAPTVSAVSTDRASPSSTSSSSGRNHPRSRQHAPSLEPTLSHSPKTSHGSDTLAPSLGKTVMTSSNATKVESPERTEFLGQNDMVHTQLQTLMKFFAEHRDEMARKHELAEGRWEDKLTKNAATHNMLEQILANQADIMSKFATFKDEVLAEFQKISVSNADLGSTPEPLPLDPGLAHAPSRSSPPTPVIHVQGSYASSPAGPIYVPPTQPGTLPPTVIPTVAPNGNGTGDHWHLPPDLERTGIARSTLAPGHHLELILLIIHTDLVHHTTRIDLALRTIHIDLAHHSTGTDRAPHTIHIDLARRMIRVTHHRVGTTTVHPVRIMIHMRNNGDVVHALCRLVDLADTMTTSIRLAVTLPNTMSVVVVHAEVPREILENAIDLTRGSRERVTDPIMPTTLAPVLLNIWKGIVVIHVIVPVLDLRNTTMEIVMAGLVVLTPLSSSVRLKEIVILHAVHRRALSGPSDSGPASAERERQVRFANELVGMHDRTTADLQDPEEGCEEYYSANEEEQGHISIESKRRWDRDAGQPRESVWKKLWDRFRVAVLPPAMAPIPIGPEPSTSPTATGRWRILRGWRRPSMGEAASRHAEDIHEAICLERAVAGAEREQSARNQMQQQQQQAHTIREH
ncbi:hypothetical protein V8D89_005154 [Ganoderma adspersum]